MHSTSKNSTSSVRIHQTINGSLHWQQLTRFWPPCLLSQYVSLWATGLLSSQIVTVFSFRLVLSFILRALNRFFIISIKLEKRTDQKTTIHSQAQFCDSWSHPYRTKKHLQDKPQGEQFSPTTKHWLRALKESFFPNTNLEKVLHLDEQLCAFALPYNIVKLSTASNA